MKNREKNNENNMKIGDLKTQSVKCSCSKNKI